MCISCCLGICLAHSALLCLSLGLPKVSIISVLPDCFPVPHPHMHLCHHKQCCPGLLPMLLLTCSNFWLQIDTPFHPAFFSGNQMFVLVLQSCLWWFCIGIVGHTSPVLLPVGVQCWIHALSGRWNGFLLVCVLLQVWWIPEIPAETCASAPEGNTPTPTAAKPAVWSLPTAVSISECVAFALTCLIWGHCIYYWTTAENGCEISWSSDFLQNFNHFPEELYAYV